ncbi:MAG: peptidase MA family metallohydrolase [Chloroflexi bacterium]|nr:peptidase MA family metallohydrolase [Chloroflexota bacterium]
MRKISLILVIFFSLASATRSIAQIEAVISDVTLSYLFGKSLTINASFIDPQPDSSFTLVLRPEGQPSRQIKLSPDDQGKFSIIYDLALDPLIPFARIYYWFEVEKVAGSTSTSPSFWFDYVDNRFSWKSNTTNLFQISWVSGDSSYGQQLQDIAREGLIKATQILPIAPSLPIRIYVYPDVESLMQGLQNPPQAWTAGHTSPEIGVILVSNGNQTQDLLEIERQIPHELMHILEYQITGDQIKNSPEWLNEGLASYSELYPDPDQERILNEAFSQKTLLSFESLCSGFSQDAKTASISYAQSSAFIKYIYGKYGAEVFPKLLENSRSGLTCSNAVQAVFQIPLAQLQKDWEQAQFSQPNATSSFEQTIPYAAILGAILFLGILLWIRSRSKKKIES